MRKFIFISVAILIASSVDSANILGVFPTPSISHQVVYHALMKDLEARGHHLTILTTDLIDTNNPNVTQIDLQNLYEVFQKAVNFVEVKESKVDQSNFMKLVMKVNLLFMDELFSNSEVKSLISKSNEKKFDLMIFEHCNFDAILAFAEVFDCPAIGIFSLDMLFMHHEEIGNVVNPVIHPEVTFAYEHGSLSFVERWESLKYYLKYKWQLQGWFEEQQENLIKQHFPTVTASVDELKKRVQLLMTNTNPALGFIRPLLPNTIQLGFMHIEPPKSLIDSDLKTFLDSSKNGIIYMSLGSNVKSKDLSLEVQQIFLKVFNRLSYDVLWKFEADNLPNKPDNVMISKWTPQSDLLAHPKIKLFITQGGQQSMEEAIDRTVPMIVIPFLGDQIANANRMVRKGIGFQLELNTMTESKLLEAINEMLKPKYKQNIVKLRELVYDQPMTSRERAVWWTEYVIRHRGAKHLEYPGRQVPFYQKYWLDFIGLALLVIVAAVVAACKALKKLFSPKFKRE
jgi:glucuronosyltransferase